MQQVLIVSNTFEGSLTDLNNYLSQGWKIASVTSGVTTVALACKGYDVVHGEPRFLDVLEKEDC